MVNNIEEREITLKRVTNPCRYFFWGIIVANLGVIFLLIFPNTHDIRKIIQSFITRFVIPLLVFIKMPYILGKKIIKHNYYVRYSYIIFLRIICVFLGSIVIITFCINFYNQFVSPTNPLPLVDFLLSF